MSIETEQHEGSAHHIPTPRRERPKRQVAFPDTPEARAHAAEAESIKEELRDLAQFVNGGVPLVEQISPSSDGRGHVRMNFRQIRALLDYIESLEEDE